MSQNTCTVHDGLMSITGLNQHSNISLSGYYPNYFSSIESGLFDILLVVYVLTQSTKNPMYQKSYVLETVNITEDTTRSRFIKIQEPNWVTIAEEVPFFYVVMVNHNDTQSFLGSHNSLDSFPSEADHSWVYKLQIKSPENKNNTLNHSGNTLV